ncbi:peptide chain release factor 1, putative [Plasmodium reichenowi]|uniref:Peptide chain release factor 1, putative n=1 Tax=Plasmodium reichenowi TaxID=5854 RepID=A0A2P9DQP6_PLARE|nr:peptide chain release factor 1, putative [Plasmodium reichenowi]
MKKLLFFFYCYIWFDLFVHVSNFYIKPKNYYTHKAERTKKSVLKRYSFQLYNKKQTHLYNDNKNFIRIEFRPGVGGEEAFTWSKELLNTYKLFAERNKCRVEKIQDISDSLVISSKENLHIIKEDKQIEINLYDLFKNESGIHQVKRIPKNDSKNRIHSSTATVAIFFHEKEEPKYEINFKDLKISTFRSSKPGGQNVNKIESGVCILHKPTGIQTECQEERTQELNKKLAMKRLIQKIQHMESKEKENMVQHERAKLIKESNRSNRIRTYNFFRGYITDHINKKKIDLIYFEKGKLEYILNIF